MRVRAMAIGIVVLGALVVPGSRAAAGGSVFDFGRSSYRPGEMAIGVSKGIWIRRASSVKPNDGPFYGYLVTVHQMNHGPKGIPRNAISLGPISFSDPAHGTVDAHIAFRVPDVSHGEYGIEVCNRPCTERWVGDLVGGWFFIGTPVEYRLYRLQGDLSYQSRQLRAQDRQLRKVRAEMASGFASLQGSLRNGLAGVNQDAAASKPTRSTPVWPIAGWGLAAVLAIVLIGRTIRMRRGPASGSGPALRLHRSARPAAPRRARFPDGVG